VSKRSLNKTLLIGCLGADPELRYTPNDGTAVATLRLATNETWKEKASGERKQRTEWHRVVCFGRLAEIVSQYLTKGSYVYFEGRTQTRQYTDRDNTERTITEVIASDMRILDAGNGTADPGVGEEPTDGAPDGALPR